MAEKKEFKKTKLMSVDDIKEILDTEYGAKLKLQDVKVNHHVILKILEPVEESQYEHAGKTKTSFRFKCQYKSAGYEPFELKIQVGEGAVKRLLEKFPNDSYVGMYAFFSRTEHDGVYPQFVNPMKNYSEPQDKADLFKKKVDATDVQTTEKVSNKLDLSNFDKFSTNYFAKLKEAKIEPNLVHMVGSYVASLEKDRLKLLIFKCKEEIAKIK